MLMVESQKEFLAALNGSEARIIYREERSKGAGGKETEVSIAVNMSPVPIGFKHLYTEGNHELDNLKEALKGHTVVNVGARIDVGELFA